MTPTVAVRRIDTSNENDINLAMQVLLRSLADEQRVDALTDGNKSTASLLFRLALERSMREGESYLAYEGDEIRGAAVWLAPGSDWRFGEDSSFTEHFSEEMQQWYKHHFIPKYEDLYISAGTESARLRKDAWKLQFLGVLPDHRGKGVWKLLLESVQRKADSEHRKVLAEVSSPTYVQKYYSLGYTYRSVKNFSSPRHAGFPIWLLVREPDSGKPRHS